MSREQIALQPPGSRNLTGFPTATVTAETDLQRVHRRDLGPWYFSSSGSGRFDLTSGGRGTCYLAFDAATAIREVLGTSLHQFGVVTAKFAREYVLSQLNLPADRAAADLCDEHAADFGVTCEIHTVTPYATPQAWATALDQLADGALYQSRFTTTAVGPNALAAFDEAGPASWPGDPRPQPLGVAAQQVGLTVLGAARGLTITEPPSD